MNIEFRDLSKEKIEYIYDVFLDAFSDYQVKLEMSFEKFCNMLRRRSVDTSVSIGIYDNNILVGFALMGRRLIKNELTAYDLVTGIAKKYQGLKLSKELISLCIAKLKENNFKKFQLEVIKSNEKALSLYKGIGFKIVREFNCYKTAEAIIRENNCISGITVKRIRSSEVDWNIFESYFDFNPSWQNSIDSVKEDLSRFAFVKAYLEVQSIGYGIIEVKTGDIPLIAVSKGYRNKSIGNKILKELAEYSESQTLSVLNIPVSVKSMNSFLLKNNFKNFVQQYEMFLDLG